VAPYLRATTAANLPTRRLSGGLNLDRVEFNRVQGLNSGPTANVLLKAPKVTGGGTWQFVGVEENRDLILVVKALDIQGVEAKRAPQKGVLKLTGATVK
jgi:hypothetical protein